MRLLLPRLWLLWKARLYMLSLMVHLLPMRVLLLLLLLLLLPCVLLLSHMLLLLLLLLLLLRL